MADISRPPEFADADRAASEWMARLESDEVTANDRADFERWLASHPENARAYARLGVMRRKLAAIRPMAYVFGLGKEGAGYREGQRHRPWGAFAVGLTVCAVVAGAWYLEGHERGGHYQTSVGERATTVFPDGSAMELNSNSDARVKYSATSRIVELKRGEAYFNVAHDAARPFWVHGGDSWVRAVGTAFNVDVRAGDVRVTVNEGVVKVTRGQLLGAEPPAAMVSSALGVSAVSAGQQADIRGAATTVITIVPAQMTRAIGWRNGIVVFDDQSLGEVVDELSRYTTLRIIVDDPALRSLSVGGSFQASPAGAETLLRMLHDGFGLTVRRDYDAVYVGGAKPDGRAVSN